MRRQERAALLQLVSVGGEVEVCGVYLCSDAPFPITPGALCREYMLSSRWVSADTRIVMEGR